MSTLPRMRPPLSPGIFYGRSLGPSPVKSIISSHPQTFLQGKKFPDTELHLSWVTEVGLGPPGAHAFSHCLTGCVGHPDCSQSWKGLHREQGPSPSGTGSSASFLYARWPWPACLCRFSHIPKSQDGWGQSSTQSSFSSGLLTGHSGNLLCVGWCGVTHFQNCTERESEIWLQKVIWQFIFRLPFSQQLVSNSTSGTKTSIILIACDCLVRHKFVSFSFFFLPVWGGFCVFFLVHRLKKPEIFPQTKHFI